MMEGQNKKLPHTHVKEMSVRAMRSFFFAKKLVRNKIYDDRWSNFVVFCFVKSFLR